MKLVCKYIFSFVKSTAFLVVLMSMLLQTVTVSINIFAENDTEFTLFDLEEDSDEEEKTENTSEKIQTPVYKIHDPYFGYSCLITRHIVNQKLLDINEEIPIPPPEFI